MSSTTAAPAPSAAVEKRKKIFLGIGIALIPIIAYLAYENLYYVSTDNAQIQGHTVMLSSKVSGFVAKVNFEENQKVKAGTVLVEISPQDYETTVAQLEGEMGSLQARARDAESGFKRMSELHKSGAVSQQQYDNADASARELGKRLKAAQAQVEQARFNLSYTQVKAPSDGVVAKKSVGVGMLAPVGFPLIGFVQSDERWVVANFKETEITDIKPGKPAMIEVDALPGRKFEGEVESLSPSTGATFTLLPPDNATGNFTKVVQRVPVRIKLKGLKAEDIDSLQAGLSAFAKVKVH